MGEDFGYGPARFLTPDEVAQVAQALAGLSATTLAGRYQPKTMDELGIYPNIWERDGQEGLDYLLSNYARLQVFYRDAAGRGDGVQLYIS